MRKVRVDNLMVERGLAESRALAQRLVMAGRVRVNSQPVLKPSAMVSERDEIEIDSGPPYVSRGGEKLEAAIKAFDVQVAGRICADVGASTGGFTDCLLQHGAARVYAIDVGAGILHWKLRNDPRVVVRERTNVRYLEELPEPVQLATIDVSFISSKLILPVVAGWMRQSGGEVVLLIKPQFEAGRAEVSRGAGVVRDEEVHRKVIDEVLSFAQEAGYALRGVIQSPLLGPKGNIEFLAVMRYPGE